jgi:protein-disulfide isomerase
MSTSAIIDRVTSVLVTIAALVAVGLLIEQRIQPTRELGDDSRIEKLADWSALSREAAVPLSKLAGDVDVFVFTDFECPFCARMDSTLRELVLRHPNRIRRHLIHFPLNGHRFAWPAAIAFECAAASGKADEMQAELYRSQSQFAASDWNGIAERAGVPNLADFNRCIEASGGKDRIDAGLRVARSIDVNRTPVVVIDGWLHDPALPGSIESAIEAALGEVSRKL